MTTFAEYASLARELDMLVRAHHDAASRERERHESLGAAATELDHRLVAQRERLRGLGGTIRRHIPHQPARPPAEALASTMDADAMVALARERVDQADAAVTEVEAMAGRPILWPGMSPIGRNVLVYALCAAVALVGQLVLLTLGDAGQIDAFSVLAWIFAGLPAAGYIGGFLIINAFGRPRLGTAAVVRSPRIGFAICFLALPAAYCAFKLIASLF